MNYKYPWFEFPAECLVYLFVWGIVHLVIFVIGVGVIALLAIWHRGSIRRRIVRLAWFLSLLLIVGFLFNGLWRFIVRGHLYFTPDFGPDFEPFFPILQKDIDEGPYGDNSGKLFGVTMSQLQLVWLLFALCTWATTIGLYRAVLRQKNQD